jgi:hypothetical protein
MDSSLSGHYARGECPGFPWAGVLDVTILRKNGSLLHIRTNEYSFDPNGFFSFFGGSQ